MSRVALIKSCSDQPPQAELGTSHHFCAKTHFAGPSLVMLDLSNACTKIALHRLESLQVATIGSMSLSV